MFDLRQSNPKATLYLDTTQTVFDAYNNVTNAKGNYTTLIKYIPSFNLTINSGSDSKFILPLKYGNGTAHHELVIDWGDSNIQTVTGTAGITEQYQGLTHSYSSINTLYTIRITGTTYLTTTEDTSYYGLGFNTDASGYNAAANKTKLIALSGSPDNLLSASMPYKTYCYNWMFYQCTSLTTAPELPATTLSNNCYQNMFRGCTSLVIAPVLPATTLANYCYGSMFYGCTSLTTAPKTLPATTLANSCYAEMFYYCTSLKTAPALPAITLTNNCYYQMFRDCKSLISAPALPAITLASTCYASMFYGCISLTTAPALPVTTLATNCYQFMFYGCSFLTTAPTLPATILADGCYQSMFRNCNKLTVAPVLSATTLASNCYSYMFYGCTSLTVAPVLPATTLTTSCYSYMFQDCTSLTAAPTLPATTLNSGCYANMFRDCTSLTGAPVLSATTLVNMCYNFMFYGCTSLTAAPALPATTLASNCYSYMFQNCTSLEGKTITIAAAPSTISWANGMFNLKSSTPNVILYLNTSQAVFDIYNVASVTGNYTNLFKYNSAGLKIASITDSIKTEPDLEPVIYEVNNTAITTMMIKVTSDDLVFIFPIQHKTTINIEIDWGDSSKQTINRIQGSGDYSGVSHTYKTAGNYNIKFSGTASCTDTNIWDKGLFFGNNNLGCNIAKNKAKVITIDSLKGITDFESVGNNFLAYSFSGCSNLISAPDLQDITEIGDNFLCHTFEDTSITNIQIPSIINAGNNFMNYTFTNSKLVTAPVIKVKKFGTNFMYNTFKNCISMTQILPGITSQMPWNKYTITENNQCFNGCSNLTDPVAYTDISILWK
jgi:hypothetical protein